MNKCVIVANGDLSALDLLKAHCLEADMIIGVDGGIRGLNEIGVEPTLMIGDFDSAHKDLLEEYTLKGVPLKSFPSRKDSTDSELAIDYAIGLGPKELLLFGMTGKRLDHGLTNIHMLKRVPQDIKACIIDAYNEIYYSNKNFELKGYTGRNLSIIPISSELEGIETQGLEYPLVDETLYYHGSRGVSNVILDDYIRITVKKGDYFIIISKD